MLQSPSRDALQRIKTERILLDPVTYANIRRLWQLMRAPNLRDYQEIPRVPLERFEERLSSRSPRLEQGAKGRFEWIIILQSTGEAVGWISIRFQDRHINRGELGYSILAPFRRKGYATEAVMAVTEQLFDYKVVDYVDAYCMPANLGSRGVLQRAGLREVQRLPNGAIIKGRPVEVLRFEIRASAWQRKRQLSKGAKDRSS